MRQSALQFAKFVVVGLANAVVGLGLIYLCMAVVHLPYTVSNAIGYGVGILFSFAVNRKWTFEDGGSWKKKLAAWLVVAGVAYFANLGVVVFAVRVLGMSPYIAQIGGSATYTLTSYLGSKVWVFKNRDTTPAGGERPASGGHSAGGVAGAAGAAASDGRGNAQ